MKRFDAHPTKRTATYKDVSAHKAAFRDAEDLADLRDRCTARWDYASPAVSREIDEYVEALLVAKR
jgi:hypothetical protein